MSHIERLDLSLKILETKTFVDGNDLKRDIINQMPFLNKFTFNICSLNWFYNRTNLPSNEEIQCSFRDWKDHQIIISCIDYFQERYYSQCLIYSYPYKLEYYNDITNHFSGGIFQSVREVSLYDERPFEHEFFLQISQSFPLIEKLKLINQKRQNNQLFPNENEDLSIIEYPLLMNLNLVKAHEDYLEQFFVDTKMRLPDRMVLCINYQSLKNVTHNFTRDATRRNCAKIRLIFFSNKSEFPKHLKEYFPLAWTT